ncbi:hypothetical protein [Zongyangia hominis]|uniref:Uncharacterized protein n=1 Tax=Zongyangia hominis TaxID=2763677 RepID=A0A926IAS4_9FIRM|nr:hypothetical protein [Zongyangia hominis]MBC8570511.1 hypothetical protein [Zongyangia hominis]
MVCDQPLDDRRILELYPQLGGQKGKWRRDTDTHGGVNGKMLRRPHFRAFPRPRRHIEGRIWPRIGQVGQLSPAGGKAGTRTAVPMAKAGPEIPFQLAERQRHSHQFLDQALAVHLRLAYSHGWIDTCLMLFVLHTQREGWYKSTLQPLSP